MIIQKTDCDIHTLLVNLSLTALYLIVTIALNTNHECTKCSTYVVITIQTV